jgi:hypothetical protein
MTSIPARVRRKWMHQLTRAVRYASPWHVRAIPGEEVSGRYPNIVSRKVNLKRFAIVLGAVPSGIPEASGSSGRRKLTVEEVQHPRAGQACGSLNANPVSMLWLRLAVGGAAGSGAHGGVGGAGTPIYQRSRRRYRRRIRFVCPACGIRPAAGRSTLHGASSIDNPFIWP